MSEKFDDICIRLHTISQHDGWTEMVKQEAQLMITNPRNAFGEQSRSPNIVPFHMLGIILLMQ